MRELALFAGAGGGLLASRILGWKTVCAVELDPYCQRVLVERQNDGSLEPFPIWPDVRTFDGEPWRGLVDIVSAGFPCQPFSTAVRGRAVAVDLWPHARRIIAEVRPAAVFAENVSERAIRVAQSELVSNGYSAYVVRVSAANLGAPHRRPRWWLLAYADDAIEPTERVHVEVAGLSPLGESLWGRPAAGEILGVDDGLACRVDAMRAIGNGQVPAVARAAFELLAEVNQ